ncbi:hypothetical protein Desgi_2944 [Desulfoscipio gibsoniae DSM 7213]|uniref:Uncharacterized protein n=1 Tax=Desulfoscipio gibsoniae DSM 7213 TaxID=767817 RepID=R4KGJ7_9FIRM|nr:hypothetical protein Desgi_2944 [Desulfoscipio gibsoniae DSM 7213]
MEFWEDTLLAIALLAGVAVAWWLVAYRGKIKK